MTALTFAPAFDVATLPTLVAGMPPREWAVALYASDMPTLRADHEPAQVVAWIVQGVERLGGELAVWQRERAWRHALDWHHQADREEVERRLFSKPRRLNRAHREALALFNALHRAGAARTFPMVEVALPPLECDAGYETWTVEVPERDLKMAERLAALGERAAA